MARILCVLYDDPTTDYPPQYARGDIPVIVAYPGGQLAGTGAHSCSGGNATSGVEHALAGSAA